MAARQTLDFECALVTGGGGGIGKAMAEQLIARGKKVIIIGRTESKLQSAAKELGHGTSYYVLDTGSIRDIKPFVERVVRERPDVDCLINNAGVQRELHIPDFDLEKADQEIDINIRGPMHLAVGFLEHFKGKKAATIMNVSSVLGFVPFSVINPVYNGTKAWAHMWSINLRQQLLQNEKLKHIKVSLSSSFILASPTSFLRSLELSGMFSLVTKSHSCLLTCLLKAIVFFEHLAPWILMSESH